MFLWILLLVSVVLNVVTVYFITKAAKRLLMFDDLWETMADDLDQGVEFFEYVLSRPVFINSPEINVMMKNIKLLRDRMMMHAENLQDREKKKIAAPQNHNPPVVVG